MSPDTKKFHELVDKYKRLKQEKHFLKEERLKILEELIKPLLDIWNWRYKEVHEFIEVKSEPPIIIRVVDSITWDRRREEEEENIKISSADGFGILTNFENMVIFYKGYFLYELTVEQYEKEGILTYFSKEKFSQIDKWIDSLRKKEVDEFLLDELNVMREKMGKEILRYSRNLKIIGKDVDKFNEIVQRILDRFLIYRFAEDGGLVEYNDLKKLREKYESPKRYKDFDIKKDWNLWWHIRDRFWEFSKRYNGRVFEKHSCDDVRIEDKTVFEILDILYSRSFRNLNVELLGSTYEKYLGYRLDDGAKLERTPEARKAGGIYYTPSYITRYIAENTIGKILDEKWRVIEEAFNNKDYDKAKEILKKVSGLKILDPACGSGSFLIQVLNLFKEFYRKYNNKVDQIKKKAKIPTLTAPELTLTKVENPSLNVLKNNIYGVDYDAKAAEITAVSLMLHILDEIRERGTLKFPSILGENIKIGNSLISGVKKEKLKKFKDQISDLIELRKELRQTDDEKEKNKIEQSIESIITPINERTNRKLQGYFGNEYKTNWRLRSFNWALEFPEVFFNEDGSLKDNPGFDAVVGNPPYFSIRETMRKHEDFIPTYKYIKNSDFWSKYFRSATDIHYYFTVRALDMLHPGGVYSFITSNYWLDNDYADKLKKKMLSETKLIELVNFERLKVFWSTPLDPVGIHTDILVLQKTPQIKQSNFRAITTLKSFDENPIKVDEGLMQHISKNKMKKKYYDDYIQLLTVDQKSLGTAKWILSPYKRLVRKIEASGTPLGKVCNIGVGQNTGLDRIFTITEGLAKNEKFEKQLLKPVIKNRHIGRYFLSCSNLFMVYADNTTNIKNYPNIYNYLVKSKKELSERHRVKKGYRRWYAISVPQNEDIFLANEKLVVPYRAHKNTFAYDNKQFFNDGGDVRGMCLKENVELRLKYILGLLNSKLLNFWYNEAGKKKGGMCEYFTTPLSKIPIMGNPKSKEKHIITLVDKIISLKKKLHDELETITFKEIANKYAKETVELGSSAKISSNSRASKLYTKYFDEIKEEKGKLILPIASKTASIKLEDSGILECVKLYLRNILDEEIEKIDEKLGDELAVHKLEKIKIPKVDVKIARKILQKWENLQEEIKETKELIEKIDRGIDRLVYELYRLTEEEIKTVEESLDSDYKTLPEKKDVEKLLKEIK